MELGVSQWSLTPHITATFTRPYTSRQSFQHSTASPPLSQGPLADGPKPSVVSAGFTPLESGRPLETPTHWNTCVTVVTLGRVAFSDMCALALCALNASSKVITIDETKGGDGR
jgi:hypothetical protein